MNVLHGADNGCSHCWHATGKHVEVLGMCQSEEICCYCGALRYLEIRYPRPKGEHGPFLPEMYREKIAATPVQD